MGASSKSSFCRVDTHHMRLSGVLWKWTNYLTGWQERYFELRSGQLVYYLTKADKKTSSRGSVSLRATTITVCDFDDCRFDVTCRDCVWYLRTERAAERDTWLNALRADPNDADHGSSSASTTGSVNGTQKKRSVSDQDDLDVHINSLRAHKRECAAQMAEIEAKLVEMDASIGVDELMRTHHALLANINSILVLAQSRIPRGSMRRRLQRASPLDEENHQTPCKDVDTTNLASITSDCDEWHDAKSEGDVGTNGGTTSSRSTPIRDESAELKLARRRRESRFGCWDECNLSAGGYKADEIDQITQEQIKYALAGSDSGVWELFAEDGSMRMYRREVEDEGGLPVDPLKACHFVPGVSALEYIYFFYAPQFKQQWDHTLNETKVIEQMSPDSFVLLQRHKTIWPAAPRESLFWSHIRRVDSAKDDDALDLYIVVNKDVTRDDAPLGSSSSVRVGLKVAMICQTVRVESDEARGKPLDELTRKDVACRILYVSQVHPGGWVPTAALRAVYRKEYPAFLRRYTDFVMRQINGQKLVL